MSFPNKWEPAMQMPPTGFGMVQPQPSGKSSNINQGSFQPSLAYPVSNLQFQQFSSNIHGVHHMPVNAQHFVSSSVEKNKIAKAMKQKQFFEQKEKLSRFDPKLKKDKASADAMIESILSQTSTSRPKFQQSHDLDHQTVTETKSKPNYNPEFEVPQSRINVHSITTAHDRSMNNKSQGKSLLQLPKWLSDPFQLPRIYQKAAGLVETQDNWVDTSRAYMLLMRTNVAPPLLGILWEMVNRSEPGRLKVSEFYGLLALVAIVQSGQSVLSADNLQHLKEPVVPSIDHPYLKTSDVEVPPKPVNQADEFDDFVSASVVIDNSDFSPPMAEINPKIHKRDISDQIDINKACIQDIDINKACIQDNNALSDSEFSDFQEAPSVPLNVNIDISRDESIDKYAAFKTINPIQNIVSSKDDSSLNIDKHDTGMIDKAEIFTTSEVKYTNSLEDYVSDPFDEFSEPKVQIFDNDFDEDFGDFITSTDNDDNKFHINVDFSEKKSIESIDFVSSFNDIKLNSENLEEFDISNISNAFKALNTENETKNLSDPGPGIQTVDSVSFSDKYSVIREHSVKNFDNPQVETWMKCLTGCQKLLSKGYSIVENIPEDILKEVLDTTQMQEYLSNLHEVWRVNQRILTASQNSVINSEIEDLLKSNQESWTNIVTISESKFDKSSIPLCDEDTTCNVCLTSGQCLSYGGHIYHAACANLWLNIVDLTLPKTNLSNTSLL